ncbi:hypothetical protein, partial [Duncaniella freteri]|uniref:hypothetical protein n=1 Tax=Duncaniella freteri TaxID=2530391 RepID=UPI002578BC7F
PHHGQRLSFSDTILIPVIQVGNDTVNITFIENLWLLLVAMTFTIAMTTAFTGICQFFDYALIFMFHLTLPPPS